ncbi:unnamed protein product [Arabidopsis thaliana]|uniref:Uncharacterized protein n=2 Tax=Arabidopsis thaliana TaxID=3702 RepID=A0A5S9XE34_ARATH|nr:unnamed protein product [Arabidopsis thaliana]
MTSLSANDRKDFVDGQMKYWRQIAESDGFDIDDVPVPRGTRAGLWSVDCKHPRFRLRACLPKIYAMVGLHRYNLLRGTNFEHLELLKYNESMNCVCSYYITSVAVDLSSQLQKTFQIRVDEKSFGDLDLTVSVARPNDEEKVTTEKRFIHHFHCEAAADDFYKGALPDWPSVKKCELQSNDWIRLYLELAVGVRYQQTSESDLSKLQVLKVAIETKEEDVQPPNRRLKSKSLHVYITFKGLAKAPIGDEIGEHVERKAIVRRVIDERSGHLTLLGGFSNAKNDLNQSSDDEQPFGKRRRI